MKSLTINLTQDQAESIAIVFANEQCKNFSTIKNMGLIQVELLGHGTSGKEYMFEWGQIINGILTPNITTVYINPATGNINGYIVIQRPVEVKLTSTINKDPAINIAISQFNNITVEQTGTSLRIVYKNDGLQVVAWVVDITGLPIDNVIQGGEVTIDANTGDIVGINPYQ